MIDTRETFEVDGLAVHVRPDTDPGDPRREWDHGGTMVCWHRRYKLGDEQPAYHADEFFPRLMQERESDRGRFVPDEVPIGHVVRYIDKHFHVLPLYLYDHSGLSMSTGGFSCPWDSGQVGWIYMSKERASREGIDDPLSCLRAEVEEYDQYLRGDVWGYEIEDADGNSLDSCWGFYGFDHCTEEATASAKAIANRLSGDFSI